MFSDLVHAWRMFVKNPGFTAIAVISIAFGTGANVAMFSAADALLLRPLPVARPDELVTVGATVDLGLVQIVRASYPDYVDIRDRSRSFDGLVAFTNAALGYSPRPDLPPRLNMVTLVSGNFFRVLGVEPEIGRPFRPEEDRVPGRDAVCVLSWNLWQRDFAGDPSVVGRTVRIANRDFTVVGVTPERFGGIDPDYVRQPAYIPLAMWKSWDVDPLTTRYARSLTVKGRLKPGVTMTAARAELTTIGNDLARVYPATNANRPFSAQTELQVRFTSKPIDVGLLLVLTVVSAAVLCVACANVSALLASRAPVRAREIALRMALGAGRARLVRQLITESLAVAVAGCAGGIAVGYVGIVLMRQIQLPSELIVRPAMNLDTRVLLFDLALAVASTLLFGVGPAMQMTRVDLAGALKTSDAAAAGRRRLTGRSALVALQVALSLVLLTISVFGFQVFGRELTHGPGFRTTQIAKLAADPDQAGYTEREAAEYFARAAEAARVVPGVRSVGLTSSMPLFSLDTFHFVPEGYSLPPGEKNVSSYKNIVDEGYFETMGIPIVAGRAFRRTDTPSAPAAAIVNETLARHYWPGGDAVGKRFHANREEGPWFEIVGVAKTTKYLYFAEPPQEMLYLTYRQVPSAGMVLLARTYGDSASMLAPLRAVLGKIDANVPIHDAQTIEAFYAARVTTIGEVITRMIGGIGLMGMTLTMIGLYGLVSYAVNRRTREIGIRIAIGATTARILRMVLREGMMPVWAGAAAGLVLSIGTARLLPVLIPLSYAYDAGTVLYLIPVLVAVAIAAAIVPARRAARVDPVAALRCD